MNATESMNTLESLTLVTSKNLYIVKIINDCVYESDIAYLMNGNNRDVWKWARLNQAKVYFSDILPNKLQKEYSNESYRR